MRFLPEHADDSGAFSNARWDKTCPTLAVG